jgi:PilZ domain
MEHRCGNRRTATAQVLIKRPDGISATAQLRNISASGALLQTHLPAPLHAVVAVGFPGKAFSERSPRQWITAHIVRQLDDGMAVEWTEFSPETVRQLLVAIGKDDTVRVAIDLL